ncbi:hypothetical protein [Streptomyces mexicanus]|uniref:Uncharacterized protein n=1 Tax=Streptomyces mexicanus TaxID=178566 RepID=A0A7X1I2C8_9ACTN|nr:hypothetical protein [Streptomyces mexicanus]MBC2867449.1 hypothetical protein [Streptomyces mexicanus]
MTEVQKEAVVQKVGYAVWFGGMEVRAAVWFVAALFEVEMSEAEEIVHDILGDYAIVEMTGIAQKIGDKRVGH